MEIFAMIWIFISLGCSLVVLYETETHPQKMRIMNIVWALTALWASVIGLYLYFTLGRKGTVCAHKKHKEQKVEMDMNDMQMSDTSMLTKRESVILGTLHCGAGCTLADIIGELILIYLPFTWLNSSLFTSWLFTYILALIFGVWFQYSAIKQMFKGEKKSVLILKALKADFFSLTAWQIGMYAFMSLFICAPFESVDLETKSWLFWLVMQGAMFCGFLVAYPVNAVLIRLGVKKGM